MKKRLNDLIGKYSSQYNTISEPFRYSHTNFLHFFKKKYEQSHSLCGPLVVTQIDCVGPLCSHRFKLRHKHVFMLMSPVFSLAYACACAYAYAYVVVKTSPNSWDYFVWPDQSIKVDDRKSIDQSIPIDNNCQLIDIDWYHQSTATPKTSLITSPLLSIAID